MERSVKLKLAYDAGVEMMNAAGTKDELRKGVHVFNPSMHEVLDGIIVAYDTGLKCVIVHPDLYLGKYDPRENKDDPKNLRRGKPDRKEQDRYN